MSSHDEPGRGAHGPDEHLTCLLAKVDHLLERRLDAALAGHGLTFRQYSVLAHIGRAPKARCADLERWLLISRQAVNNLVQRLLEAELIKQEPRRGRQALVLTLTVLGSEVLEHAEHAVFAAEAATVDALAATHVEDARRILQHLLVSLVSQRGSI